MRPIPWDTFTVRYLSLYLPPMREPATYRQVRQILREFGELPGFRTTAALTEEAVAAWVARHKDRSPARVASLLRCMATAAKFAVGKGFLGSSPFEFRPPGQWVRSDKKNSARSAPTHRGSDEIARVLDQADAEAAMGSWEAGRLQALVYVYAYAGLRKMEALHLETHNVDLERRVLTVEPKECWHPKTVKSAAKLPIAPPLRDVLRLWLPRCGSNWLFPGKRLKTPWTSGAPTTKPLDQVKALGKRAGVEGLTILSFRKTIGTHAKSWGFSQLELKALLRHTNVRTQDWYDEEDVEVLRPAADKVAFRRSS